RGVHRLRKAGVVCRAIAAERSTHAANLRRLSLRTPAPIQRSSTATQQVAGDHDLLDLAGAFVEAEDAPVAVEALDAVVGDVARAAENLHRLVGHAADHLAREVFGAGRFHGDVLARVALLRRVEHHAARRIGFGLAVRQHALDELEFRDLLAELLALAGVIHAFLDQPLRDADADARDVQAATVEHLHRDL